MKSFPLFFLLHSSYNFMDLENSTRRIQNLINWSFWPLESLLQTRKDHHVSRNFIQTSGDMLFVIFSFVFLFAILIYFSLHLWLLLRETLSSSFVDSKNSFWKILNFHIRQSFTKLKSDFILVFELLNRLVLFTFEVTSLATFCISLCLFEALTSLLFRDWENS